MNLVRFLLIIFIVALWTYMTFKILHYLVVSARKKNFNVYLKSSIPTDKLMSTLALLSSAGLLYLTYSSSIDKDFIQLMWYVHIPWLVLSVVMPLFKNHQITFSDNQVTKFENNLMLKSLPFNKVKRVVIRRETIDVYAVEKSFPFIELRKEEMKSDTDWIDLVNYFTAKLPDKTINNFPTKKPDLIAQIMSDADEPDVYFDERTQTWEVRRPMASKQ